MSHYDTPPPPPHRSTADWPAIARSAAERLLGEPNSRLCNRTELRWGTKGSFALNVAQGRWTDFEAGTRGGALDLGSARDRVGSGWRGLLAPRSGPPGRQPILAAAPQEALPRGERSVGGEAVL